MKFISEEKLKELLQAAWNSGFTNCAKRTDCEEIKTNRENDCNELAAEADKWE